MRVKQALVLGVLAGFMASAALGEQTETLYQHKSWVEIGRAHV